LALACLAAGAASLAHSGEPIETPAPAQPETTIELFAAEPDVVTPTGITIDRRGRVFVIESHTHFPPAGYAGPPADRIRLLEDTDGRGGAVRITTFFEGSKHTMNLAADSDGSLIVATRKEVFRLRDTDGDGRSDQSTTLTRLVTDGDYPHNGLSGFAIDWFGRIHFGLGENLGAEYSLVAADGRTLTGGGEGGSVFRIEHDGSGLVRMATGFWNPFHLAFDAWGNLFAVDNDPDSRPPCRLIHVVPDGDYGYRFRNGRKGLHPFTAWNGELPGTLPMLAGTGEAPSGIVALDPLPASTNAVSSLLVTSWGDHRIEQYALLPRGATFAAERSVLVQGGENFRPVGIARAPDGTLYVSDWVSRSYELHGLGRVWRIRTPQSDRRPAPPGRLALPSSPGFSPEEKADLADFMALRDDQGFRNTDMGQLMGVLRSRRFDSDLRVWLLSLPTELLPVAIGELDLREHESLPLLAATSAPPVRAAALRRLKDRAAVPLILPALSDPDPFVRQAALNAIARSSSFDDWNKLDPGEPAGVRLARLLFLRASKESIDSMLMMRCLEDPDPDVRFSAIVWVGEEALDEFRPILQDMLRRPGTSRRDFEGILAALARLDGESRSPGDESAGEDYVAQLVLDDETPDEVRRRALRMLRPDHPALSVDRLAEWACSKDEHLAREAAWSIALVAGRGRQLIEVATADEIPASVRAVALLGLTGADPEQREVLLELAHSPNSELRDEALRSLRGTTLDEIVGGRLLQVMVDAPQSADLVNRVIHPSRPAILLPPADLEGWIRLTEGDADPDRGERIFFHPRGPGCHRCHAVDGRGGSVGPDLSGLAAGSDRAKVIESLVYPSREVAPRFATWIVERRDGTTFTGFLASENPDGTAIYVDAHGTTITVGENQIISRTQSSQSIMPENLAGALTAGEFRDLVRWLVSRGGEGQ
jgi:putative membrane-bound dehydrogenase-like protein